MDMNDIRPLKSPVDIKGGFPVWLLFILILIVVAIAMFIYFKNRKKTQEKPETREQKPEDIARDALKALLEMKLPERGLIKEYYIRLSDIIRAYIENRYRIFAMDRTTWELFQEMKSRKVERLHLDKINNFLEDSDMVKFAKYIPDQKEIEEAYKKAEEIIEITTPKVTNNKAQITPRLSSGQADSR